MSDRTRPREACAREIGQRRRKPIGVVWSDGSRDYYEWTEAGLQGHAVYRGMGCNSCHRALGVGEIGVAPVLEGEGTRRTQAWLTSYFEEPAALVPGTAHDGSLGPDLRVLPDRERDLLVAFLFGLKANPGSPNHPIPPPEALVKGGG